jgi:hypothetical protein
MLEDMERGQRKETSWTCIFGCGGSGVESLLLFAHLNKKFWLGETHRGMHDWLLLLVDAQAEMGRWQRAKKKGNAPFGPHRVEYY